MPVPAPRAWPSSTVVLTSTSPGPTREAMDAAFADPGPVPDEPDGADPPNGNPPKGSWPNPPDGAPPKPLPGPEPAPLPGRKGAVAPVKPFAAAVPELPMASPMNPPNVPATSKAAMPPATASTRRLRRLSHGFSPPGPGHPAEPPGGGPYAQALPGPA